ncbi:MAG: type II toxin-antitoxin system HigB family toxin [Chroococcidiopsis sp.]
MFVLLPLEYSCQSIFTRNNFDSLTQLRATFPNADLVGTLDSSFKSGNPPNGLSRKLTVFNIGGNKYRLIAAIHFNRHKVYIRHILTHAEYDKRCDPALCEAVTRRRS